MIIDEEVYLEHYGAKGMKWGVRNKRDSSGSGQSEQQKTSKKKRAAQIAVVAGVVIGGAVLAHRSGVRMSSVRSASSTTSGSSVASGVLARLGNRVTPPRMPGAIPLGPVRAPRLGGRVSNPLTTRASRLSSGTSSPAALRASIAQSIRAANSDMRARDNALNIPIHMRTYISEWD